MLKKIIFISVFYCSSALAVLPIYSGIGGNFTALDTNNQTMQLADYKHNVVVLAFGYTNCADICPFTLGYLKGLYEKLNTKEQAKVKIVFVTVDPSYDTPKHLKAFMHHFNQDFIGITGSKKQIDQVVNLFQAEYTALSNQMIETKDMRRVVPKNNDQNDHAQLFTHSVTIYLLDKHNRVRALEYTGTSYEKFTKEIRELLNEK